MPTVRYRIRNEYGLADPELYRAADKDDPEAVLEGVAMAGLVGVLRQLGDLAEFAAEIFHDLHEEVTTTAARGHGLILRVKQLEAEFPSIEKAFLSQTNHSQFAYNDGADWHANLRMDQNLVTQGDMPRFVLDSYEECRGPPRLFMLDKFDVAGAGACLKRYSDPSFFKMEFSSSGMMEDVQWEKKAHKIRKKAPHWRSGETSESFLAPLLKNLPQESSDQVSAKVPTRRTKLKSRNLLDSDITSRKSFMEHLIQVDSQEQKVWPEISTRHSPLMLKSIHPSGLPPEVHETIKDAIDDSTVIRETYLKSPTRKEMNHVPTNELENHKLKNVEILESVPDKKTITESATKIDGYISDKARKSSSLLAVDRKKPFDDVEFSEGGFDGEKSDGCRSDAAKKRQAAPLPVDLNESLTYAEFMPEGDCDEYKSDGTSSDVDNYLDAINTSELEVETEFESRVKSDPSFNMETHRKDSGIYKHEQMMSAQTSEPDSAGEFISSRGWNNILEDPPSLVISDELTDKLEPPEQMNGFHVPVNQDNFLEHNPDKAPDQLQGNGEVTENAVNFLPNRTCNSKEFTGVKLEVGEAPSGSCVIDVMSSHIQVCPEVSDEAQPVTAVPDDSTGYLEDALVDPKQLDHKAEELSDFTHNPDNFTNKTILSSESEDLSVERKDIPKEIHPAKRSEEHISKTTEGTVDMSDHLSETEDNSAFEKIPEQYTGKLAFTLTATIGEQEDPTGEAEPCLDGSISPNIYESSTDIGPAIAHPDVLTSDIVSDDLTNSHEVSRNLDGKLPHRDDMGFAGPTLDSRIMSDDSFPSSDICETDNSTEDVEPAPSEDTAAIQGKTIYDEDVMGHVKDQSVSTVQLGPSQDSRVRDNGTSYHENISTSDPASSLSNSQSIEEPDVFPKGVQSIAAGVEDTTVEGMEERETSESIIVPHEIECFSDAEESQESCEVNSAELFTVSSGNDTSAQLTTNFSTEDASKTNDVIRNTNPFELGNISDTEEPQESHAVDSRECLPLYFADEMFSVNMQLQNEGPGLNSDGEEPTEAHHAALMEHLPLGYANEILINDVLVPSEKRGPETYDSKDLKQSPADSEEHFPLASVQNGDPDGRMKEGAEPAADFLRLANESTATNLHEISFELEKPTEFNDSLDEYVIVEADKKKSCETCSIYSKASEFNIQLQENYLPKDAGLDQHDMEVKESPEPNNFRLLGEDESRPMVSSSEFPTLHPSYPSDSKSLDIACIIPSESSIDKKTPLCTSESEDSEQDGEHLEASDTQFQRSCRSEKNLRGRISSDLAAQPSKPVPCVVNDGKTNEVDIPLLNISMLEKVEYKSSIASRCSSEISVSFMSSISATGVSSNTSSSQSFSEANIHETSATSIDHPISETSLQENSEMWPGKSTSVLSFSKAISENSLVDAIISPSQDISETNFEETDIASSSQATSETSMQGIPESCSGPTSSFQSQDVDESQNVIEAPPLPPLPPLQWRLGKLPLSSLSGDTIRSQLVTSPFMEVRTGPQGSVTTAVDMVQPGNSFISLPLAEKERSQHGSLILEKETVLPLTSSELPWIPSGESKHRTLPLDGTMAIPSNPFQVAPSSELPWIPNEESKHRTLPLDGAMAIPSSPFQVAPHAADGKILSSNFVSVPTLEEGHHGHQRMPQVGHLLSRLELKRSQQGNLSIATESMPPLNPLLVGPLPEEWKQPYNYGVYGGESMQHPYLPAPLVARGPNMLPYGFLYSMGENTPSMYNFMVPTVEGEKPRYRSIRDRPRDPLIEAVAAHDKSMLRKVSELDRPSVNPVEDEKDSLLDQIKNKSFNLKPVDSKKPNFKGVPQTNLKVAAILEKANAIRQACAGSDEEEDDDRWSDS
ncbi:uncharacterized protein A4U43_C02F4090 [Asparagus officinalis]|uniref:Protein SCAR n=1 Tax=Asparagus officinalis TaxID=4686 RepID=A0A5P1FIG2_ASPOF|nr:uncharacterized protein A4U43_C02F4090 [Asparagus officinalis]